MSRKLSILNIIMWSIILVNCSGIFISSLLGHASFIGIKGGFNLSKFFNEFNMYSGTGSRDEFVTVKNSEITDNVSDISLDWIGGEINILKSSTNSIIIEQKAEKDIPTNNYFEYKLSGADLVIKDGRATHRKFSNSNWNTDINIYLPEKIYSSIDIESVSGNIQNSDIISCDTLDIDNISGHIDVVCSAKNLDMETVSGDIDVHNIFTSGQNNSKFTSISGKINLTTMQVPNNVNIDTVSGDFEIIIPENDGFTVKLDKISGDLESDFSFSVNGSNKSYIYKNGNSKFSFDTISGDMTISKAN